MDVSWNSWIIASLWGEFYFKTKHSLFHNNPSLSTSPDALCVTFPILSPCNTNFLSSFHNSIVRLLQSCKTFPRLCSHCVPKTTSEPCKSNGYMLVEALDFHRYCKVNFFAPQFLSIGYHHLESRRRCLATFHSSSELPSYKIVSTSTINENVQLLPSNCSRHSHSSGCGYTPTKHEARFLE